MAIKSQYQQNKKLDSHGLLLEIRWFLLPFKFNIFECQNFTNKNVRIAIRLLKEDNVLLDSIQTVIKINH